MCFFVCCFCMCGFAFALTCTCLLFVSIALSSSTIRLSDLKQNAFEIDVCQSVSANICSACFAHVCVCVACITTHTRNDIVRNTYAC